MKIQNPLYVTAPSSKEKTKGKNIATARIENTVAGVCPKCQQPMGQANLGQCMGNQTVYFCSVCRVAEPIPV